MNLDAWAGLTPNERESLAKQLARELPSGFALRGVRTHEFGGQTHPVAEFEFDGAGFVLIPGGTVTLGYDADRPWEPTAEERASWESTEEEYRLGRTLPEHIAAATLRPRTVSLGPFLVEATPREVGWRPLPADDPEVRRVVREQFRKKGDGPGTVEVVTSGATLRVTRDERGTITAARAEDVRHAELAAHWAREGFRLPTSDEWEHVCGSGAATLFRWGDHVPCDRYPTDISPEEAAWRRAWVLSGGKLEYPPGGFPSGWDLHRRPNAFGALIAFDPYHFELVAEADVTRGGDGGCAVCGGAGFFIGWLTLATAYFEEHTCRRDPEEPVPAGYTIGRRVLALAR